MPVPRARTLLGLVATIAITAPACAAGFEPDESAELRRAFPTNAGRALDHGAGFDQQGDALTSRPARLGVEVRERGLVRVRDADAVFEVTLHELGALSGTRRVGHAASYARAGGRAYWSASQESAEEWLSIAAPETGPLAAWQIEGATLRAANDAVELVDPGGTARLRVTAPAAFGAGERALVPRLLVRGDTLELFVDGAHPGESLLVDPKFAPAWIVAASVFGPRVLHAMTSLPDGEVVIANGYAGNAPVLDVEVYDPSSNRWREPFVVLQKRAGAAAVTLQDSRLLVVGGNDGSGFINGGPGIDLDNAEVSDPLAGVAPAFVAPMHIGRVFPAATVLADGRVLVAGGSRNGLAQASFDLYDPIANAWTFGTMPQALSGLTATLLGDGRVLAVAAHASIFDPATSAFSAVADPPAPRALHTATLLLDGRVLVAGGATASGASGAAYLYDPATDHWSATGFLTSARQNHTATRLADGRVLVAGGFPGQSGNAFATTEIYDPVSGGWASGPAMNDARAYHTAALLPGGQAIVVAGANSSVGGGIPNTADLASVELYSPYLRDLGEPCGASTACGSGFCVEGVCCDSACDDSACSVCAVSAGATTNGHCVKLDPDACKAHPCTGDGECDSHHCADGVCCDKKCDGKCETCALVRGTCIEAPEGTDPHGDCVQPGEPTVCGPTCDGKGGCTDSILNTPCIPAMCSDETHAVGATTCQTIDGGLGCPPPFGETTDCAPFKCDPQTGTCKESCTSVHDCPSGYVCTPHGSCERTPKETAEDESGCAVTPGSRDAPPSFALLAFAGIALAAARRRARV